MKKPGLLTLLLVACTLLSRAQVAEVSANPGTTVDNPFGTANYAVSQAIYTESEIGGPSNFTTPISAINTIEFGINGVGTHTSFGNINIYLKNVPLTSSTFTGGTYSASGYSLVFSGSITLSITGWTPIILQVPFTRTGGNNLEMLIERADGISHPGFSYNVSLGNSSNTTANTVNYYNGATPVSGSTTLSASRFRPAIRISHRQDNAVPVTLMSFNAQRTGKVNQITWSTSQELNTDHFVIEHSTDGRNFAPLTQLAASGTSPTPLSYSYTHNTPIIGINYYRLRVVDKDNSFKNSLIRSVRNEGIADVGVYPNPVNAALTVNINADRAGKAIVTICDVGGKNIYRGSTDINLGANYLPINTSNIASGTYIIKVQLSDDFVVKKFNKL